MQVIPPDTTVSSYHYLGRVGPYGDIQLLLFLWNAKNQKWFNRFDAELTPEHLYEYNWQYVGPGSHDSQWVID